MTVWNRVAGVLGCLIVGLFFASVVSAAGVAPVGKSPPFGTAGPSIPPEWGHWSDWSVSPTSSTANGVSRTGTGSVSVDGIKVPVSATWGASRAAVGAAGAAAAALCSGSIIGAVACAAAAEYAVEKGIEICNRPGGWCTRTDESPVSTGREYSSGRGGEHPWFPVLSSACEYERAYRDSIDSVYFREVVSVLPQSNGCSVQAYWRSNGAPSGSPAWWSVENHWLASRAASNCPSGYYVHEDGCHADPRLVERESPAPYADPGFIPWLNDWQGRSPRNGPDLAEDATDRGFAPELNPGPNVTAEPATGPTTITESDRPGPNGSTDHVVRETTTTVTPNVTNNNTNNVNITYNTTTTVVTHVTNSETGVTTTTTETTTSPSVRPDRPDLEIPDDYNKEVTQQEILKELTAADSPPLPPDQGDLVEQAKTQAVDDLDDLRTAAETLDKDPWFSWVWTPPSGTCSAFAGTVHGFPISWDVCPTVANIRDALGWLFAIFAAIEIYGQLFRRGD